MARLRRPRAETDEGEGEQNTERWLLTYSDMITLLLALFVILFAMSTINSKKFNSVALGFREAFNPTPGPFNGGTGLLHDNGLGGASGNRSNSGTSAGILSQSPITSVTTSPPSTTTGPPLATIEHQIQQALAAKGLANLASTSIQPRRGLVVQILADKVFFATDSAQLGNLGNEVVDTIASVLRTDPNRVEVEGYTDSQPITGGPYTSNMELSAERAVNVVVRLHRTDGIDEQRLSATGYGQNDPAAPNDSAAHMALNRRIDVVVLGSGDSPA